MSYHHPAQPPSATAPSSSALSPAPSNGDDALTPSSSRTSETPSRAYTPSRGTPTEAA
eukprot:CAMPEP_0113579176 /NCGR_PEP_ID=MMETSP0015_2-20120614/29924_1 /TAXON_ID=2838 /ORGANISM="Odontella" /LENGTH=57 /DNA_ID=CAMNT_0000483129 /DNA_START=115 /DNA_END=286 /DNA_ORIENTATION=+ /assembly_acc=CAM_ASM_000160